MINLRIPILIVLVCGLLALLPVAPAHDNGDWPERGIVLVIGDQDARELAASRGAGGLLARALRSEEPRRFWRFDHMGRGGVEELLETIPDQLAQLRTPPLAVILQVGQHDAWDPRAEEPRLSSEAYSKILDQLITAIADTIDAPIIIGSPLLIGEGIHQDRPEDTALEAIATINQQRAEQHSLRHFPGRAILTGALKSNANTSGRRQNVLTRDGERLLPDAWQLLTPALAQSFGFSLGNGGSTGSRASGRVQRVLQAEIPPRSMVHVIGDMRFVHDFDRRTVEGPLSMRWPENTPLLYHRGRNIGVELFRTSEALKQSHQAEIIEAAVPPSLVIMGYGFAQTNNLGLGQEQPEPKEVLAGLAESVAAIRQAGIQVILVSPFPMRGDQLEEALAYARECEQILATIAAQTGAILAVGREEYERLENKDIRQTATHAIMRSIGLDPRTAND